MGNIKYSTDYSTKLLERFCHEVTDNSWYEARPGAVVQRGRSARVFVHDDAKLTLGSFTHVVLHDGMLFVLGNFTLLPRSVMTMYCGSLMLGDGYLGYGACIASDCRLWLADVDIGAMCYIADTDGHLIRNADGTTKEMRAPTTIHEHVFIGPGSTVLRGSEIGAGSVIGPKSFIRNLSIPDHCYAEGVPAKPVEQGITWQRRPMDLVSML